MPELLKDRIRDLIASDQDEIRNFTADLVAVPTENPPGRAYRECIGLIESKLRQLGIESTTVEVPPAHAGEDSFPRWCLLGSYGNGGRALYFHGHYDVVPAADPAQFQPVVREGKLFGRGSADMKSGLAAMIYAVKAIKNSGIKLDGRIGLVIVPDEETGGARGTRHLVDQSLLGEDGIAAFTPEPTGGVIWNANRGAISLRVTVKGRPTHVCLQHQGINAFEQMMVVADALSRLKAEVETRTTAYRLEPEAARRSILMLGGECHGGTNFNVVPGECSFTIDRRMNPEEDLQTEKKRLFDLFALLRRRGIDLDVEVLQEGDAAGVPESHPVGRILAECIETVGGTIPSFEMCPGLLETRFYTRRGIPAFGYGPGLLTVSHGPEEFVELQCIYNCAAIYALTATRLLSVGDR